MSARSIAITQRVLRTRSSQSSGELARHVGRLFVACPPSSGRHRSRDVRAAPAGALHRARCGFRVNPNGGATSCGKDARLQSPETDFSNGLENPASPAGFTLSRSSCGGEGLAWPKPKQDISFATKVDNPANATRVLERSTPGCLRGDGTRIGTRPAI